MPHEIKPSEDDERDYFDGFMAERQALVWASALRVRLLAWERLVAEHLAAEHYKGRPPAERPTFAELDYWRGEVEHHMVAITANNMLRAIPLLQDPPQVPKLLKQEVRAVRDLLEHWTDNMPIFSVQPRPSEPSRPSGQGFAIRNPDSGPYCWWRWNAAQGAMVTPRISAADLRSVADQIIARGLERNPSLADFVEPVPDAGFWADPTGATGYWPRNPLDPPPDGS